VRPKEQSSACPCQSGAERSGKCPNRPSRVRPAEVSKKGCSRDKHGRVRTKCNRRKQNRQGRNRHLKMRRDVDALALRKKGNPRKGGNRPCRRAERRTVRRQSHCERAYRSDQAQRVPLKRAPAPFPTGQPCARPCAIRESYLNIPQKGYILSIAVVPFTEGATRCWFVSSQLPPAQASGLAKAGKAHKVLVFPQPEASLYRGIYQQAVEGVERPDR
jgi:hypothetical protein